ncbi:MAG: hypothetical protein CSA55_03315 [Ilumatobacter coccineus]|uniref:DUF418 domain-containing protein n=1 Tax=Ilumatobacter coccineus TaxID=467094 RepID=A0A2G6K9W1_9ACTN|nr:MAG: hypothetical protein CSA55_03315 [Ilumatobacter coccineus]
MSATRRLVGPDVVRAVAMFGVVLMNYHGYLILRDGQRPTGTIASILDPWEGPLANRFAATFVLTAGVGVSLMTRRDRSAEMRWRLVRRGLVLYGLGMVFDMIWPGTILPYYGAMFILAATAITLPVWAIATAGIAAAAIGAAITPPSAGFHSPTGLIIEVVFHGTHPLFPWLIYFCAGIILGRYLFTDWWRPIAAAVGAGSLIFAIVIAVGSGDSLAPPSRSLPSTLGALGVALLAFVAIFTIAERWSQTAVIDRLRRAGQLSLSIYLVHGLVFNLMVDWLDLVQPGGLAISVSFTVIVWLVTIGMASAYQERFGRGPAETLYRRLTA